MPDTLLEMDQSIEYQMSRFARTQFERHIRQIEELATQANQLSSHYSPIFINIISIFFTVLDARRTTAHGAKR